MRSWLLIVLYLFCASAEAQNALTLSSLRLELDKNQSLPLADTIEFELVSAKADDIADALLSWKGISVDGGSSDTLNVRLTRDISFDGKFNVIDTSNSFVIDLEEESTQEFVAGFEKPQDRSWTLNDLTEYVHGFIVSPTYINGFNIASVVAKQRSGDCTEYAVLSTALARSLGIPARVVLGSVIIEEKDHISAFGHAWAEVWHNNNWQVMDAALHSSPAIQLFYLPTAVLDNEGPGFAMALLKATGLIPKEFRRLRSALE